MPANQPAATDMAIVDQVRDRDGVLLVMATSAMVSSRSGEGVSVPRCSAKRVSR